MEDSDATTDTRATDSAQPDEPDTTAVETGVRFATVPLWVWPAGATLAVAVTGQAAGPWWAAVLIVLLAGTALTAILGPLERRSHSRVVGISVLLVAVALGGVIAGKSRIDRLAHSTPAATPAIAPVGPGANLRGANLAKMSLARADLRGADLAGANLAGADLTGANLSGAILRGADLHDSCLRHAQLSGSVLAGADFTGADVRDALIKVTKDALPAAWPPTPSTLVTCSG